MIRIKTEIGACEIMEKTTAEKIGERVEMIPAVRASRKGSPL
jgi:hypothetical protein